MWTKCKWLGHFLTYASVTLLFASSSTTANARPCPLFGETQCADTSKCIEDLKNSAGWVIEATISGVEQTGKQTECEEPIRGLPISELRKPDCASVDSPEKIKLSKVRVVRGKFPLEVGRTATTRRKDICFSGPLADVMNPRPELKMVGERVRFYGDNRESSPLSKGFFYLELAK